MKLRWKEQEAFVQGSDHPPFDKIDKAMYLARRTYHLHRFRYEGLSHQLKTVENAKNRPSPASCAVSSRTTTNNQQRRRIPVSVYQQRGNF
eukprot:scaffold1783_cov199-Chaetoceros_neogracile.AAC.4